MKKSSENPFLYRIIRYEHLVDLFQTSELFMARPSSWEDPYEKRLDHPGIQDCFAQCWCERGVSDAMWRIYSPHNLGVRIKVRRSVLRNQLSKSAKSNNFHYLLTPVEYERQSDLDIALKNTVEEMNIKYTPRRALRTLLFKRKAFDHEAETRLLIHKNNVEKSSPGLRIKVEPHQLIETVLADPRMPDAIFKSFKYYMEKVLKYKKSFRRSGIYTAKKPFRVGYDED
jgi:DUF2971 family protein